MLGDTDPCSQRAITERSRPVRSANWVWVRPARSRASLISGPPRPGTDLACTGQSVRLMHKTCDVHVRQISYACSESVDPCSMARQSRPGSSRPDSSPQTKTGNPRRAPRGSRADERTHHAAPRRRSSVSTSSTNPAREVPVRGDLWCGSDDELLDVEKAAELLTVKASTLRFWVREGRMPCIRLGPRHLRWTRPLLRQIRDAALDPVERI